MAHIVNNILEPGKSLQLGAEELVRPLGFGNNWTRIRIQLRCRIMAEAVIYRNAFLAVGLCKGTERTFASQNTQNYVGVYLSGSIGVQWYFNSSTYIIYLGGGYSVGYGIRKQGLNWVAASGGFGGANYCFASRGSPYAGVFCFTFLRNLRGSYRPSITCPATSAQVNTLIDSTTYSYILEDNSDLFATSYLGTSEVMNNDITGVEDDLDAVSVYWSTCIPTLQISDVSVIRYQ